MPSISDPNLMADDDLFTVANLALWAGDAQGADDRFSVILRRHQVSRQTTSVFDTSLVSSSQRALRQLRRRLGEYRRLGHAARLASNNLAPQKALRSRGEHLSANVWVESERELELRCYLNDLAWEADFYKMAATQARDNVTMSNVAALHYGSDRVPSPSLTEDDATTISSLGVGWTLTIRDMFLDVTVSDFCTFTARSVWIGTAPAESVNQITSIYQDLLDKFDPGS